MHYSTFLLGLVLITGATAGNAAKVAPDRPLRLCVLDQSLILQRSRLAANMATRFQQVRQQVQQKFQNDSRTLDADVRALEGVRSVLTPAVLKAKTDGLAQRRLQLKAQGDQINQNLAALDKELTSKVATISEATVRAVERERGCSLLIASGTLLHIGDASLDITPAVIERMNATAAGVSR